jgi:hypothetical protein
VRDLAALDDRFEQTSDATAESRDAYERERARLKHELADALDAERRSA